MHSLLFLENYQILMEALKFMDECDAIIKKRANNSLLDFSYTAQT